jgi:cytochrome o ubiquinol oxidase operon protein cyoD
MYHLDTNMMPADHGMHMPAPTSAPAPGGAPAQPHQHPH